MAKPIAVQVGNITVTPISAKQQKILEEKIKKRHEGLRRRYRGGPREDRGSGSHPSRTPACT